MSSAVPAAQPLPIKHLLQNYTTSHPLRSPSPLPPSSRVDPKLTQRLPPPTSASPLLWTLPTWWLFFRFLFTKGIHIFWALLCHVLVGPKRASWGYSMTFITSFMRNIADHSTLADIVLIRRFISLHFLVPLPGDAVVTPITFTVPLRQGADIARGFLREWDLAETGTRELSGEWVVGTDVWKRLKAERRARQRRRRVSPAENAAVGAGVTSEKKGRGSPAVEEEPETAKKSGTAGERVIYYIHGGAYYVGNAATHRLITIGVSKACNARVFAITYRLAPEHAFPLPLHDVLQGYIRLLSAPLSIPPENIVIAGDSAGGGLSLALCMYLRDEGYKMPAGLVLMSPWVDLTMSCGSWDENADSDVVPRPEADDHLNPVGCYLGPEGITKYLTHPYASPLFGDFHNLPPMLIQSGDSEVLRDEITLVAHKATLAGVNVTHELYEDMVHVFQMFPFLPATTTAINNVGRWMRSTLPKIEKEERSARGLEGEHVSGLGVDVDAEMEEEMGSGQGARIVRPDGQETGVWMGRTQVLPDEIDAARDQEARRSSRVRTPKNAGSMELASEGAERDEQTTVDPDLLTPRASGSLTPTNNRVRSPTNGGLPFPRANPLTPSRSEDPFSHTSHPTPPHTIPSLRRAQTSTSTPFSLTPPPAPAYIRRRRPTASLLVSPATSSSAVPSNPVSPTPSVRKRLRSNTVANQPHPTTRARSKSHSDIFSLVEGYVEGGAANETVVYAAGGEVKSVGVLGEDGAEEGAE